MRRVVRFAIIGLILLPMLFIACSKEPVKLYILEAGSLVIPFGEVEKEFERIHPDIDVLLEGHGSIQVIRHITEIHDEADLAAVADHSLIPMLMYPIQLPDDSDTYANWTISFATNHLGLAYTPESRYADEINADNWVEIVFRDDVTVGSVVGRAVGEAVCPVGETVAVSVAVLVGVDVAVLVGVDVAVLVGVDVAVPDAVDVAVSVAVGVTVRVAVGVIVPVAVSVAVGGIVGVAVGSSRLFHHATKSPNDDEATTSVSPSESKSAARADRVS